MSAFFQNSDILVPYHQVSHVHKFPPDRLEVWLVNQQQLTLLNDECKVFLKGYLGWLQQ